MVTAEAISKNPDEDLKAFPQAIWFELLTQKTVKKDVPKL